MGKTLSERLYSADFFAFEWLRSSSPDIRTGEIADRDWSEYKNDFSDKAVQGFKLYFSCRDFINIFNCS